jgi:hypothetical protein
LPSVDLILIRSSFVSSYMIYCLPVSVSTTIVATLITIVRLVTHRMKTDLIFYVARGVNNGVMTRGSLSRNSLRRIRHTQIYHHYSYLLSKIGNLIRISTRMHIITTSNLFSHGNLISGGPRYFLVDLHSHGPNFMTCILQLLILNRYQGTYGFHK